MRRLARASTHGPRRDLCVYALLSNFQEMVSPTRELVRLVEG